MAAPPWMLQQLSFELVKLKKLFQIILCQEGGFICFFNTINIPIRRSELTKISNLEE